MEFHSADLRDSPADTTEQTAVDQAARRVPHADSRLLAQIGQRDEQALASLYDRYGALVYSIALRITHERALAETVVQHVFHTVWQAAVSLPIDVNVPVWLGGMARQQALATQNGRARAAAHQQAHATGHAPNRAGRQAPDARRAFSRLLPKQREAIELAYYSGLNCPEIAQRLDESESTIKARLRTGLSAFSEHLQNTTENLDEPNQ